MTELEAVLDVHSGPAVLEGGARVFLSLCREETAWCSPARAARDSLVQRWVDRLTALLGESLKVSTAGFMWTQLLCQACIHVSRKKRVITLYFYSDFTFTHHA